MPTLNVNKIGDYNSIGLSFNVWVKGDKWNTDEAVTIRLNITYEKRASHRNYYNGNPGSFADDVFYYNGGEADVEINDGQNTTQLQFSNTASDFISYTTDSLNNITIKNVDFGDVLKSDQTDNWKKLSALEYNTFVITQNSVNYWWTNTYSIKFTKDTKASMILYKDKSMTQQVVSYEITITENAISFTENAVQETINYSINEFGSKLTLSGFTGDLAVFNLTYE